MIAVAVTLAITFRTTLAEVRSLGVTIMDELATGIEENLEVHTLSLTPRQGRALSLSHTHNHVLPIRTYFLCR